jgi:hypothetical protein
MSQPVIRSTDGTTCILFLYHLYHTLLLRPRRILLLSKQGQPTKRFRHGSELQPQPTAATLQSAIQPLAESALPWRSATELHTSYPTDLHRTTCRSIWYATVLKPGFDATPDITASREHAAAATTATATAVISILSTELTKCSMADCY